jgi:hypothetical protein
MSITDPPFGQIIAVSSDHYNRLTNMLCERNADFTMLKQVVHILTTACQKVKLKARLNLRSSLFCDVTQHTLVDSYRRFGITCLSHLQW